MREIPVFRSPDCANTLRQGFATMNLLRQVVSRGVMIATLLIATAGAMLAQVSTRTVIRFDINVPFALTPGGYNLAPGHYLLDQDTQNPNLFRLYRPDSAREPVAVIYALRGCCWAERSSDTRIELGVDESGNDSRPVLRGFKVSNDDPWQVLAVKVNNNALMTRVK